MLLMQGARGSIPGQGNRSHMPQLKILCVATNIQHSQINTFLKKETVFTQKPYHVCSQEIASPAPQQETSDLP